MTILEENLRLPCGAVLKNRIAKSGMSEGLATRDGRPTDRLNRLYATWAQGGAGLLITGNVIVDRHWLVEPGNVILDDDRDIPAYKQWAEATHAGSAALWMQINHPGRVTTVPFVNRPVAPSAKREPVPGLNLRKPRELSVGEIEKIVAQYARTAALAVSAGFDGVQIHAAHGYLLSQFLSPLANTREDRYGGDPERRRRVLLEIVAATRESVGPRIPISVKLNCSDFQHGGLAQDEALDAARALDAAGIDLLEISGGNYATPPVRSTRQRGDNPTGAYFADFAQRARAHISTPLMVTGGVRGRAAMEDIVSQGIADVVGLARPMAFVADYPARILAGELEPTLPPGPPSTGYRPADGYLELAYHSRQLHRIAAGLAPQTHPGLLTILRSLATMGAAGARQIVVPR